MKRQFINSFLIVVSLITFGIGSSSVYAVSLSLEPQTQTVFSNDMFDVSVVVSGLGNESPLSLGAFDLDVTFDTNDLKLLPPPAFGSELVSERKVLTCCNLSSCDENIC